jgi:hypothetical protein
MDAHPTTGKGGAIDTCDNPGHGTRGVGARLGFLERKRPAGPIYTSAAKTRRAPDLVGPSGVWRLCGSGFILKIAVGIKLPPQRRKDAKEKKEFE